ncbi:MAG TPA: hypothetical protein VFW05_16240 [Verrucomicrobiae bacterium]|jgi:hypothetical protein|nr:hypothetical protein [Verrucomicrobiae bacterium]
MNPESQDFEQLRRLFAVKRHEQPPPGYFDRFSRDVIARIKAGEQGDAAPANAGWIQKLWAILEARPVFAGAFGAAVCAMLISAILNSESTGSVPNPMNPAMTQAGGAFAPASTVAATSVSVNDNAALASGPILNANPADTASLQQLFDFNATQPNLQVAPVSFQTPAGN